MVTTSLVAAPKSRKSQVYVGVYNGNGHHVEGRRWTHRLLERLDEVPLVYHPSFLLSAGLMACIYDPTDGTPLFLRARDTVRDLGDRLQMAWALAMLSYAMFRDSSAAMVLVEESLAMFRELDHQPGIAQTLNIIGKSRVSVAMMTTPSERMRKSLLSLGRRVRYFGSPLSIRTLPSLPSMKARLSVRESWNESHYG
jgi:hypothetical protein